MQTIRYTNLTDYLKKSDTFINPRTVKVVEVFKSTERYSLKAVTFPNTFMIEWFWTSKDTRAKEQFDSFLKDLKDHDHSEGTITEISGERR